MFYLKHNNLKLDIAMEDIYTTCAECGKEFVAESFWELVELESFDIVESSIYCDECHNQQRAEEKEIADRYNFPADEIQRLVVSGMNDGLTRQAALAGVRLALSMETGQEEYFSLEETAAASGHTMEELQEMVDRGKITPIRITPSPILEAFMDERG